MQETLLPAQNWRKSKAYRLLFDEVLAQQEALLSLRFPIEGGHIHSLAIAFHSIKGGAGFMGLTALAECASRLEKLFTSTLQFDSDSTELAQLVKQFQSEVSILAEPEHE